MFVKGKASFLPNTAENGERGWSNLYESDIKELELGREYLEEQIFGFILDKDVIVLCDNAKSLNSSSKARYKVEEIIETYIHQRASQSVYSIPSKKSKLVRIIKVN